MSGHKGLYDKYEVKRKETGEICDGAFVLRPVTDQAAWQAVMFYSYLTHNPRLGKDLRAWLYSLKQEEFNGSPDDVQEVVPPHDGDA
jgi:hypothetical protein